MTYLFNGSSFKHLLRSQVIKGALREHLQQGISKSQAKLLQVLLRFTLIADLDALQSLTRRHVSLLFAIEFFEQNVAQLSVDTSNSILATDSRLGAYMEV